MTFRPPIGSSDFRDRRERGAIGVDRSPVVFPTVEDVEHAT
jgi:hypothetical protein